MGSNKQISKFSKKNRLLLTILLSSIAVVFAFLGVLLYINYYARVSVVLTTITRYRDGDIKNVSEYDIITVKKGRSITTFPEPSYEGYSFGGWYFDKECTNPYDYTTVLDENLQIYGKMDLLEYSIELVLDEKTNETLKVTKNITQNYEYTKDLTIEDIIKLPRHDDVMLLDNGTEISVNDYKLLNKVGYTFEGWGFASTSNSPVTFDYRMNPQNITFYALWKPIQVELRYCTLDLSFAQNSPQSNFVEDRINGINGGVKYNAYYNIYVSETLDYRTKVREVIAPVDEYKNFEFKGWYLDPEFTIRVNFNQLYIRNGYFSLSEDRNINILLDETYFDDGHIVDDDTFDRISQYASSDESNSYINVFAKWELKKYTVRYHLNIPAGDSYVDTAIMSSIVRPGTERYVYSDNADTLMENTNVHQGKHLVSNYINSGVLYDANYFKNVVYVKNDLTGLPLYTLSGWNSKKDGSGYDASNTTDNYFDKSKFVIGDDDVITIYAQWTSYYRINYYLTDGAMGNSVLLSTINVESDRVEMPSLESLVVDIVNRKVIFTEQQKTINDAYVNMNQDYFVPLNKTFVGWINDYSYIAGAMPLYIENFRYGVGTTVDREKGIYLNEPVRNLYTAWVDNVNTFSYNLGEDGIEKADFSKNSISLSLEGRIIVNNGGTKTYREYTYDKTNPEQTILTIQGEEFLITKKVDSTLYSLNCWKLKDGTIIEGHTAQDIIFDRASRYIKFINNSEPNPNMFKNVETGVYFDGLVDIDNETYFTRYDSNEDRSYIVLKAKNVTKLVFEAVWVKNVVLTYNAVATDVVWHNGLTADGLSNTAGGSIYMQVSDPAGNMVRPCYRFYGWSTVNREGSEVINFNTFIEENKIYKPNERYDLFENDTELFAVWQPIVYNIYLFQQAVDSPINSSAGKLYVSKECFVYNRNEVTDGLTIEGNVVKYKNIAGDTITLTMTTSAVTGYGLSGWSNASGGNLVKDNNIYTITPKDDVNNLFDQFPPTDYNSVNIYPVFSILRFDVVFKLVGEGIDDSVIPLTEVTYDDVVYGTNLKNLVPKVYYNYYEDGYTFKGWNISGDVDSRGNVKEDYIANINSANITVRSDLVITLVAEKLSYTIKIIFNTPSGDTKEIINYQLNHFDTLSELTDEIEAELERNQFVGYNFSHWQTTIGGLTTNLTKDNFASIRVTTPLELYSKYTKARVVVKFNYVSDADNVVVEKDSEFMSSFSLNTSSFAKQPSRAGHVLKGWTLDDTKPDYFRLNSSFIISEAVAGDKLVRPTGADYYVLNIYAKWVESITLSFDTSYVTIAYNDFPTALQYEKGSTVFFKDIPYISTLSNDTIVQNNGLGEYSGIWVDPSGREYNASLRSSFITLNDNIVLKPKFTPKNFLISYTYYYLGEYFTINELTKTVNEQYAVAPSLLTKSELDAKLSTISGLSNYRATGYYLTKAAFENNNATYKFDLGAEFDFVNNPSYVAKANNSKFEFYIILQELTSLTYYTDRDVNSAISPMLRFDRGIQHIIGDTNGDGTIDMGDYAPSKNGFIFAGWNSNLNFDYVEYTTGTTILTGVVTALYPVWSALPVTLEYRDSNNDLLAMRDDLYSDDIITLRNFTREGSKLTGWATTIGGASEYQPLTPLDISDAASSIVLEGGTYYLRLYAVWEVATYTISFDVYSASGVRSIMYGKLDGTISNGLHQEVYNNTTQVNYTFPTTASTYEIGGQKYRFTGKWTDGLYQYTDTTGNIKFIKDYIFAPVYEKVHTLTFMNGSYEIFKLENVTDGTTFTFNYATLLDRTADYNTTLASTGSKVIAYTYNGTTYNSSSSITVDSSITFTAVVVDLINIVVFKDLAYDGTTFTFANAISQPYTEKSSSINLNDYATELVDCRTVGFVATTNMSYSYIPNPASLVNGTYNLATSSAVKGTTLYFYPVIEALVEYYVNTTATAQDSEYIKFGNEPTKTAIENSATEYYTGWKVGSLTGADYVSAPVSGPLKLYTISKPYLQLMVAVSDSYISNAGELVIDGKKPTDNITLPSATDVTLYESNKYTITAWNISYLGSYVMDDTNKKVYALGSTITLQSIIDALGLPDPLSEFYFEMSPVIGYNLQTLNVKNSSNITYEFNVALNVNTTGLSTTEIDNLKNAFIVDNSGYAFYLLYDSEISVNTTLDTISFVAYLKNGGNVVITNNMPTTATITISKAVDTGYTSIGWYYYNGRELLLDGTNIQGELSVQAQTASLENIQLSINLKFKEGATVTNVDASNIDSFDDYFYIDSASKYAKAFDTTFGSIIQFNVIIVEGYEFVELRNGSGSVITANRSVTGTINTFVYEVNGDTQIYVIVKKSESYKPSIVLNTTAITGYDPSLINSASTMYVTYKEDTAGASWNNLLKNTTEYKLNWSEFANGYQYANSVGVNNYIQIFTAISSEYYYVDQINVYNDGSLLNGDGGNNSVYNNQITTGVKVTGVVTIELVLKQRTYSINYYNGSGTIVSGERVGITSPINVDLPTTTKEGYVLNGYRLSKGTMASDVVFVEYITSNKSYTISELQSQLSGVNQTNQNTYILLEPVWVNENYTLSITSDYGYFLVNGTKSNSVSISVPYNEILTFNKTAVSGVFEANSLTFATKTYTITTEGIVQATPTSVTVEFVPYGTWNFVEGYTYNTNQLFDDTYQITNDISFVPNVEKGEGTITISVNDADYNNDSVDLGDVVITNNTVDTTIELIYDEDSNLDIDTYEFETQDDCTVVINLNSVFGISSCDIVIDGIKLSECDDIDEFKGYFENLNVSISGNTITLSDLIYNIEIVYNITREEFNSYIQVTPAAVGSDLETIYADLTSNTKVIAQIDGTSIQVGSNTLIEANEFRQESTYTLVFNNDYFVVDRIYYIDNTTEYVVFGNSIDDCLSSFDPLTNELTIVAGGENGNDITFYVELSLKTLDVIFHSVNDVYLGSGDYSSYDSALITPDETLNKTYGSSISLTESSLFKPTNTTYNALTLEFVGWTYYNGNYEKDLANSNIDNSKFEALPVSNWEFNATNGNLHLFSNWSKLFNVNFIPLNDGISATQSNLPEGKLNASLNDEIVFTVATRNGFTFAGYSYSYDGDIYYLRHNGTSFTALEDSSGVVTTIETFNASQITLAQLLTSAMASINVNFEDVTFEPIWTRNNLLLTIANETSKGAVEQYKYNGHDYELGSFNIQYYYTVEAGTIEIEGVTYNCIYVTNNTTPVGAIVVKPDTAKYYKFGQFKINGNVMTVPVVLEDATTINVLYAADYIPHVINLTWDKDYNCISYSIVNLGDKAIKVETYNAGNVATISTITAGDDKEYTLAYDQIVIKALRDSEVNVKIILTGYHYVDGTEKSEILLNIDDTNHVATSEATYTLKVNRVTVNLSQYMLSDTETLSNAGGSYVVSYFAPIEESGLITRYDINLTNVTINSTTSQLTNIVYGTKLYFTKVSETHEIVQLLNGNTDITDSDAHANNIYATVPDSSEYDIKVVFDMSYALVNFEINNQNYASAYFETTSGTDANSQLVAFANMLTNGYSNSSSYLTTLFADTSLLTSDASSMVASNIIKTNGVEKTYYTEGEFITLFNYGVNENLAINYYNDNNWKNIWFEGFNFASAYPTGTVTINDLYIGAGIEEVVFQATTDVALILAMEGDFEEIENTVDGNVINTITAEGAFSISSIPNTTIIMANSEIGYATDSYKKLYLKVKNNTALPEIIAKCSKTSYTSQAIPFSEKVFSNVDSSGLLTNTADGLGYNYTHSFRVRYVTLMLETTDKDSSTNYSFEQNFGNEHSASYKVITVNYATTFEQIKLEYRLQNSYTGADVHVFKGFYTTTDVKIDDTGDLAWYFDNINPSFYNGTQIYINAVYEKLTS